MPPDRGKRTQGLNNVAERTELDDENVLPR
jgi:hypothetical protein